MITKSELEKMVEYEAEGYMNSHVALDGSGSFFDKRESSFYSFKSGALFMQEILMPEVESIREDLGFWKKEAVLHSDAREQLKQELYEAKARIDELEKFFCEIAKSMSGIRIAVDYMATRTRATSQIHETNIDYFKKLDARLFELDNKIFEFGNFKNGEFVFKAAMESEKK